MVDAKALEGHLYGVPLEGGLAGVCLVARTGRLGALGYFSNQVFEQPPELTDASFSPDQAAWVGLFGDLGIINGEWPLIDTVPDWNRDMWPLPVFGRLSELSGRAFRVTYDDRLRSRSEVEAADPDEVAILPVDMLAGSAAAERRLSRLLGLTPS
jgi:hypothetical protein